MDYSPVFIDIRKIMAAASGGIQGEKQRKQTSTYSTAENRSTRLNMIINPINLNRGLI
jgi:hypothetical protein